MSFSFCKKNLSFLTFKYLQLNQKCSFTIEEWAILEKVRQSILEIDPNYESKRRKKLIKKKLEALEEKGALKGGVQSWIGKPFQEK